MARPTLERKKNATLPTVRLYPEELDAIKANASACGETLSQYVTRKLVANSLPVASQSVPYTQSISITTSPSSPLPKSNQGLVPSQTNDSENVARDSLFIDREVSRKCGHVL